MDTPSSLAIVALAALIHASFQLSLSVLTLLSGHAIGTKRSQAKVLRLSWGFIIGVGVMTLLVLSFISLLLLHSFGPVDAPLVVWATACGLVFGIGVAVWLFYFRKEKGTKLWIPRPLAEHLSDRSKATKHSVEAFSLGLTSVIGELIFILPSMIISALVLLELPSAWQLAGIAIYVVISLSGLLTVHSLIGSGHSISKIQKWREDNKSFLQFAGGSALVALGFFVYISKVVAEASGAL
ncbi:MAG: rane protein of unknown function [Candidatus Saccharibacteria bacterium]|nr:rane protein of unknown function [Candidatus Saccharibacteria bacterium]MDB5180544.1 rane protein of unknown function [Candidatus Saccharibacteria bacterium]